MNRRSRSKHRHGTRMAVATLCGLTFLPGCVDLGDLNFGEILDALGETGACDSRNDGVCDDGRAGSASGVCPFGSDPEDCEGIDGGIQPPSATTNLTGTWTVTEIDSSNCDDPVEIRSLTWDVSQDGSNVTVFSVERGAVLTGTISGNTINLQGSFPEDGGTTTVTSTNITLGSTGNTISGSQTWFWTGFSELCSGTTSVTGSRN